MGEGASVCMKLHGQDCQQTPCTQGLKCIRNTYPSIPGHLWQGSTVLENESIPLLHRNIGIPANGEGWGLYSEQLADEIGMYRDFPTGRIGMLLGYDALFPDCAPGQVRMEATPGYFYGGRRLAEFIDRQKADAAFQKREAVLGLTPYDRRRLEWTIATAADATSRRSSNESSLIG